MRKIDLLRFVSVTPSTTSRQVAEAFEIKLSEAAVYLRRTYGTGHLIREKIGRSFVYQLSAKGQRRTEWEG
jgi:DNA-binding transcriptional regulator PaaX